MALSPVLREFLLLPIVAQALFEADDGHLWKIEVRRDPASGLVLRRTRKIA